MLPWLLWAGAGGGGIAIPSMRRYARGSIVASSSAVTLAQYRAQCVAANEDATYVPPDPITSDITPPVADDYILQQRFLLKIASGSPRWTRFRMRMPVGADDALALFMLRSNKTGTISSSVIASTRQHAYNPSSLTVNSATFAVTDAVWGAADADGDTYCMLEAYFIEASGGQLAKWEFSYIPSGGAFTALQFVNKAGGLPTEQILS